jgi:Fic family protein
MESNDLLQVQIDTIVDATPSVDPTHASRLKLLLPHAVREGTITRAKAGDLLGGDVSSDTLKRALNAGIEAELLLRFGSARATAYAPSAALLRRVRELELRRRAQPDGPIAYNSDWIASYRPNVDRLLSDRARATLMEHAQRTRASIGKLSGRVQHEFLIDVSFASSWLEGNRYSLADTRELIENGLVPADVSKEETQMILNHHRAASFLVSNTVGLNGAAPEMPLSIDARTVREIHSLLSQGLLKRDDLCGAIRDHAVEITSSAYQPPATRQEIEPIFRMVCEQAAAIEDPLEQAFFLLTHLPYLQPFSDCNKRTARIASNIPLLRAGLHPISWMGVDEDQYIDAILAVYEHNDTSLLEQMFVETMITSGERLREQARMSPARLQLKARYAHALEQSIREVILDNEDITAVDCPHDMRPRDAIVYAAIIRDAVERIMRNPLLAPEYNMRSQDILQSMVYVHYLQGTQGQAKAHRMRG